LVSVTLAVSERLLKTLCWMEFLQF